MIYILLIPYTSDGEAEIRILSGPPLAKGYWWQEVHYCQEVKPEEVGQLLIEAASDPASFLAKLRERDGLKERNEELMAYTIPVRSTETREHESR